MTSELIEKTDISVYEMKNEIINIATATFIKRLARLGETDSGAYRFYASRLERDMLIVQQEYQLMDKLKSLYLNDTAFYEIGAGIGMFCVGMVANGFSAVSVDVDPKRIDATKEIKAALVDNFPELEEKFYVEYCKFGADSIETVPPQVSRRVAVFTNFINGWSEKNIDIVVDGIKNFDETIIDVLRFAVKRDSSQSNEVIELFSDWKSEPLLDLGNGGLFYRFHR